MDPRQGQARRILPVAVFGIAMAHLETAVVLYLRRLMGLVEPRRDPSVYDPAIAAVEVGREAAVLAPVLVALLMCAARIAAIALDDPDRKLRPEAMDWLLIASGVGAMLSAFMADAIAVLPASAETLSGVRPVGFRWTVYLVGLVLAMAGIARSIAARTSASASA